MDPQKMISITQNEYDRLVQKEAKLNALEAAGVDNWDGYDYALDILNGDN